MQTVKDQTSLARAFVLALQLAPELRSRMRLVMVGDGPLRGPVGDILREGGAADLAWLPGERNDIPAVMRTLDCFVLPSLAEGISNTILEAMACGIPVIATNVGGNTELVDANVTGKLVRAGDADALARAMIEFARQPERARAAGLAGRARVVERFSLQAMVRGHVDLYDSLLRPRASRTFSGSLESGIKPQSRRSREG